MRPGGADGRNQGGVNRLELARGFGFDRGKHHTDPAQPQRFRVLHFESQRFGRRLATADVPSPHAALRVGYSLGKGLTSRALGGGQRRNLEVRMSVEGGQHLLSGNSGGANDCSFDLHLMSRVPESLELTDYR